MKFFIVISAQLKEVMGKLSATSIPTISAKTMYKVQKLAQKIEANIKDFEEIKGKLINTYAIKDEEGKLVINKGENGVETVNFLNEDGREFQREINELMNVEITELIDTKFDVEEFDKIVGFSSQDMRTMIDADLIK